jgi:hypothetical protein
VIEKGCLGSLFLLSFLFPLISHSITDTFNKAGANQDFLCEASPKEIWPSEDGHTVIRKLLTRN